MSSCDACFDRLEPSGDDDKDLAIAKTVCRGDCDMDPDNRCVILQKSREKVIWAANRRFKIFKV